MTGRPDPVRPATDDAHPPTGWVRLARLGRPFQLRGALRAQTLSPAADLALLELGADGAEVWLSGAGRLRLREARRIGGGIAVSFQGSYTPERARAHVHRDLWGPGTAVTFGSGEPGGASGATDAAGANDTAAAQPPPELLEGAAVRVDGRPYGRVARVVLGAQDLLSVEGPDGPRWVPWQAPYVRWDGDAVAIDDPPPGLLDDE